MGVLAFNDDDAFGRVMAVDTATVRVSVQNVDQLRTLQVNRLVALQSSRPGQHLIGMVQKIVRTGLIDSDRRTTDESAEGDDDLPHEDNSVKIALVGTLIARQGTDRDIFRRTLESVPEIDAACFKLEGEQLTNFMDVLSRSKNSSTASLSLGHYTLDDRAEAYVDGNRFFQRHAVVVGSTGSGKSWTTARLLEQVSALPNANAILFDLHGEYTPITGPGIRHLRIAGPSDLKTSSDSNVIYLPYWLLTYELLVSMLVDRSDQNAPNQTMVVARTINDLKRKYLEDGKHEDVLADFTLDSPVPFPIDGLLTELQRLDTEMVQGSRGDKQGPYHGKLSRLIARVNNRRHDRRVGFMFSPPENTNNFDWLGKQLCGQLMLPTSCGDDDHGGVKIIDCSDVPSDIIPLVLATLARLVFTVQQWTPKADRHPIGLICEEAHLYIPARSDSDDGGTVAASVFSRIAKEGRKYGVGLVVISQRPSEVSRTVLSQCSNFVALRLANAEDQGVIQRLLPDSLGGFAGLLPVLDTGEAIVVGDACLLPSRIRISEPVNRPASGTVDFWDEWAKDSVTDVVEQAVHSMRCQNQAASSCASSKKTRQTKKK